MFGRLRWAAMGVLAGAGASLWAERKVKAALARCAPQEVVSRQARHWSTAVRTAVGEGRDVMRQREAELRARVPPPPQPCAPQPRAHQVTAPARPGCPPSAKGGPGR